MTSIGKEKHEKVLSQKIEELKKEGHRVIRLNGKSPDAIAVKNGKVIAVEVEGVKYKKGRGWKKKLTPKMKRKHYSMFDNVDVTYFKHDDNSKPIPISNAIEENKKVEEAVKKIVAPVFQKEIDSNSKGHKTDEPLLSYYYRPNNLAIRVPFDRSNFNPSKTSVESLPKSVFMSVVPMRGWNKYVLKNFYYTSVQVNLNNIIVHLSKGIGKETRCLLQGKNPEEIDAQIDRVEENYLTMLKNSAKKLTEWLGGHADLDNWNWERREYELKGTELIDNIPKDMTFYDDVGKKVYPTGFEYYNKTFVKTAIKNDAIRKFAPDIADSIDNIGTDINQNLEKIAEANLNTIKTIEKLAEQTKYLAENINIHIPAIKKLGDNADKLGDKVDNFSVKTDEKLSELTTVIKKLDRSVEGLRPKKKIKKFVEKPRKKTPSDSICPFCNKRMPWDEEKQRWVCEKDNFIRIWDDC